MNHTNNQTLVLDRTQFDARMLQVLAARDVLDGQAEQQLQRVHQSLLCLRKINAHVKNCPMQFANRAFRQQLVHTNEVVQQIIKHYPHEADKWLAPVVLYQADVFPQFTGNADGDYEVDACDLVKTLLDQLCEAHAALGAIRLEQHRLQHRLDTLQEQETLFDIVDVELAIAD